MSEPRQFSADEIVRCQEAMAKPAPLVALGLIASGRVIIELSGDGRDVLVDAFDGQPVRDPDYPDRKMMLAGAWPLYRAGMIDDFGVPTQAGRTLLANSGRPT